MMYNAYETLYPAKKEPAAAKNLNFSNLDSSARASHSAPAMAAESVPGFSNKSVKNITSTSTAVNESGQHFSRLNQDASAIRLDRKAALLLKENSEATNKKLLKIEKELDNLSNEVRYLATTKSNQSNLNDQIKNLYQVVKNIADKENSNFSLLYQNMNASQNEVSHLGKLIKNNNAQIKLMLANQYSHREKLRLRAIITGRAWLVNEAGVTYTLTKGSEIPGYGKVVKINDSKEQVVMSSGYIFR
ncbi:hypothetical protein [Piscirickettsia litoralis]|uniref:hypothetical protein n=1 Tax=Piscirickettsia litoralis TaxID=1891921 RepID=UPI001112D41F|nr:hypothetical protein [Piscirickettsia litoralis]